MADYSTEQNDAYNDIADVGCAIVFVRPPDDNTPDDNEAEWEGNSLPPVTFNHVALIVPLAKSDKNDPDSNHTSYIPGKNLTFELKRDMEFTDTIGKKYAIKFVQTLAPNPQQVILYTCEVALWPAA